MFARLVVLLAAACVAVGLATGAGAAEEKKEPEKKKEAPVVITSPKDGEEIERTEQVEGRLNVKEGWPVVLVKPLVGAEPWWVQPPVEELKDREFSVQCYFGNEETKPGTKFRIVVLVVKNKEVAGKEFEAGVTLKVLPPATRCPRSDYVAVRRK